MKEGWLTRLKEVIDQDDRSMLQISRDAGLGRNFLQQLFRDGKEPGIEKLSKILGTMNEAKALYVIASVNISPDELEFLKAFAPLNPEARKNAAAFLRSVSERPNGPEQESSEPAQVAAKSESLQ